MTYLFKLKKFNINKSKNESLRGCLKMPFRKFKTKKDKTKIKKEPFYSFLKRKS